VLLVAGVGLGSLTWVVLLASGTALARRAAGPRAMRIADAVAGLGLIGFGGALALTATHDD
jgi:putative LysE/RhtB family amino acid efflux pump